jgi:hypothetical protein
MKSVICAAVWSTGKTARRSAGVLSALALAFAGVVAPTAWAQLPPAGNAGDCERAEAGCVDGDALGLVAGSEFSMSVDEGLIESAAFAGPRGERGPRFGPGGPEGRGRFEPRGRAERAGPGGPGGQRFSGPRGGGHEMRWEGRGEMRGAGPRRGADFGPGVGRGDGPGSGPRFGAGPGPRFNQRDGRDDRRGGPEGRGGPSRPGAREGMKRERFEERREFRFGPGGESSGRVGRGSGKGPGPGLGFQERNVARGGGRGEGGREMRGERGPRGDADRFGAMLRDMPPELREELRQWMQERRERGNRERDGQGGNRDRERGCERGEGRPTPPQLESQREPGDGEGREPRPRGGANAGRSDQPAL